MVSSSLEGMPALVMGIPAACAGRFALGEAEYNVNQFTYQSIAGNLSYLLL